MLNIEMALIVNLLLLWQTPTLADVASDFARCELEAQRIIPAPPNKGAQNWAERAANLQKRAENVESCMRAAGYRATTECSAPLKTYESCMKIADEIKRGPNANQHVMPIGIESVWTMSGTCRPRSDCRPIVTSPVVGGVG